MQVLRAIHRTKPILAGLGSKLNVGASKNRGQKLWGSIRMYYSNIL